MRFAFIDAWRHQWRVATLCRVMRVSERGYRSWRDRPTSTHARTDMKVLAHIREQYSLSLGSYGRPRMTMELKEAGLDVGERRVGRLMRLNGQAGTNATAPIIRVCAWSSKRCRTGLYGCEATAISIADLSFSPASAATV
jgi:hypothetical protein